VGGPGNSLHRNYQCSIEKDINLTAESSNNMNARFVNLFWRHDKPWINRKVRGVNLRLDQALLECGKSHICVTETTSFQREDLMTHGLHPNSQGKKLLLLRVQVTKMCQVLAVFLLSPVQETPLFWLKSKSTKVPKM
jgi:hypothetical protein